MDFISSSSLNDDSSDTIEGQTESQNCETGNGASDNVSSLQENVFSRSRKLLDLGPKISWKKNNQELWRRKRT